MGFIRERKLKNKKVRFQAEIRMKGYKCVTATFDRKTDATAWVNKTEADMRANRYNLYSESRRYTFKQVVERYFEEQKITIGKRGHLLWWQKELGHLLLSDVRPSVITEKKQKLLKEKNTKGKVRSASTCNRYLASLSHLLSICWRQWEWIEENPLKKITREKEPQGRTRFLSSDERQRFLEACQESSNSQLFFFVVMLLSTGARYGEIRNLKWTDADLIRGRIIITKSKNSDMRSIPVRGLALKLLNDLSKQNLSLGYIFPGQNKKQSMDFRRSIKTAIKKAGLKGFRPHDCRHSYATEMLAQGLSLGEIGHLLGHRSVVMTQRYAHLVESRSIDAVSKMTDEIFKEVKNG